MKVVSFVFASLLPTIASGLLEKWIIPKDLQNDESTLGINGNGGVGPLRTKGGGKIKSKTVSCKSPTVYDVFVHVEDIEGYLSGDSPFSFGVGGLPLYLAPPVAGAPLVGLLTESIQVFLNEGSEYDELSPLGVPCAANGIVSFTSSLTSGFVDQVAFQGMFQKLMRR
jgi:hypothetical protein